MGALVLREDNDGVCTLTLNRADKLNALNVALFEDLDAHVRALQQGGARVVILRGAGACFSAGHDLTDIAAGEALPEPHFQAKVIARLADLPLPIITAVQGHCYTGGLELALAGDIILASESAKFADTHARFSLVPVWGLSQRLVRRVGTYKARLMMFACRRYSGREALEMGLADICVADADYEHALAQLAADIAANSPHSHAANKRLLLETDGWRQDEGLAHEMSASAGRGPDFQVRVAAFNNRKK